MDNSLFNTLVSKYTTNDGMLCIPKEALLENIREDTTAYQNKPKQPKSAFFLWCDTQRANIKKKLEEENDGGQVRLPQISKELSKLWKQLDEEARKPFQDQAKELQDTYKLEMEEFRSKYGNVRIYKSSKKRVIETQFETPEGWEGPFDGYLENNVAGYGKAFKTFAEAHTKANELGESCGGITLTTSGYKLRKGTFICTNPKSRSKGEKCWVKTSQKST